ncbi:NDR1/HIN1-like protein 26 [Salvia miltiorrhiza]|uniref:NDR1/HIN1-like protein 26 n=1 Tax=Salvia miltiorrhiza TaxID=226208 RepID=UPI0025AC192E|nr:NDR1/HIN1-like protein 26 [Salvia miltiorrhiza]
MSVISEKSPKDCATKKASSKLEKKTYLYLSTLLLSLLSLILLIYLILHPSKPHFSLREADINQLNLSFPSLLNSSIQITLQSDNPNTKVGIYYDEFVLYASYKGQRITPEAGLPPFYQGHGETSLLSASLVGFQLPVAPSFAYEVQRDQTAGRLALTFKAMGKLRWKVGTWVSGRYRFIVSCVAVMPLGPTMPSPPLRSRQTSHCSTSM